MPATADTAAPWPRTVFWALAMHVALLGAALALALWSPYLAGYFALFACVILMIMAPILFGAWSLSAAAILAGAGVIGAVLAFDRARELGRGVVLRDVSVTEAAQHPEATGFIFREARVLGGQTGSYRHTTYRTHGSGPNVTVTFYVVAPLVPRDWQPGAPVPAWVACGATYESDCRRRLDRARPVAAVILRRYDRETYYAPAVAAALRRHGLAAAPGAPILSLVKDPTEERDFYRRIVWAAPIATFALWLIGFACWRLWRRFRLPSAAA